MPGSLPAILLNDLFVTTIPVGIPAGVWTAFLILTAPNAQVDDSLEPPPDILAGDRAGFIV